MKKKKKTATYPLAEVIALDAKGKAAIDREFIKFYRLMKKRISRSSELKDLQVPLESLKRAIIIGAFGRRFGIPHITVEEPQDWET